MVYELRPYRTVDDWTEEHDLGVIVWETDEITDESNFRICGKLVSYLGFEGEVFEVPDGIETIGYSAFMKGEWGAWDSSIKKIIIPASVKKIEDCAFSGTTITEIEIHPDSKCAKVMNNGLYSYNGDTLYWIMNPNGEDDDDMSFEYIVPDGVKRLAADCIPYNCIEILTLPASVIEISLDIDDEFQPDDIVIKAPANSYAIKFAQEHDLEYIEI